MVLNQTAVTTTGAITVGTSISRSLDNHRSLLDSTITQILNLDFQLYGSDITTIIGSIFLIGNFIVCYRKLRIDKRRNKHKTYLNYVD